MPQDARRVFDRENVDVPALIVTHEAALAPCDSGWLADRLRLLWKSSTPSGSLDAKAWLHETGRLLSDIPHDILAPAIDEAVRKSERGFMPSVGQIRAIAEPMLTERRRNLGRLKLVRDIDAPKKVEEPFVRCTPEQAAAVIREVGLKIPDLPPERAHKGPPQKPTRADYIRWGVDPADIPNDAVAEQAA